MASVVDRHIGGWLVSSVSTAERSQQVPLIQISNWTTRREHRFRDTILFEAMLPARDGSAGNKRRRTEL
ncbi:uncharacterized protein LOC112213990 [Bombus impatiens]|uniref:Uncharacterized protein LOC112213990 n=1 Tax=Bombus impatiens TaxID=132113 RepID=A0A6P8L8S2_BOMIM|nr:uncharacterized protein LOC112213990 [Bombus impatiens]